MRLPEIRAGAGLICHPKLWRLPDVYMEGPYKFGLMLRLHLFFLDAHLGLWLTDKRPPLVVQAMREKLP